MKSLKGFYRGINFGGWFSQCDYSEHRLDTFIIEKDFENVRSWGLDHVRLPIDYNILIDDKGAYIERGFERIDRAVNLALKYELNIIIDLHKTEGFSFDFGENETGFFDSRELQEKFIRLWAEIARRFAKYSGNVAFELLNEITDMHFIGVWNKVAAECIKTIREYAPDVPILVGSYWNNSAEAVKDLAAPYDDNTFYNFHCYAPLLFTHQGATWTPDIKPEERYSFEEMKINEDTFKELFSSAIEKAEAEGTGLYCGEYGVIDIVSPEETLKWFKVINKVFEEYKIGRAAWSYKEMDFGLSDERMLPVIDELVKYL